MKETSLQSVLDAVNNPALRASERLRALRALQAQADMPIPQRGRDVNNHIHTVYSFSPYTPAMAAWRAYTAGLCTAGIVDHDSVAGVSEFIEAGEILRLPITAGAEIRCDHSATAIGGRRTNNPDQDGISYVVMHGIPRGSLMNTAAFLRPIHIAREQRNRRMCESIAALTGISLSYDADVLPLTMSHGGGSVTERHLLYALTRKILAQYQKGPDAAARVMQFMELGKKEKEILLQADDPWYDYRLLGIFKANLIQRFYVPAGQAECPPIDEVVRFSYENNIVLTYPYLGDVGESPTGDKKAQAFEDAYLDDLFSVLAALKIQAVSYMPSRNTPAQISRLRALCDAYGMLQITGEDINSPIQSFICMAQRGAMFDNLYDTTWALIGHEAAANKDASHSFLRNKLPLQEKIAYFKEIGLREMQ